jgi:competence protein ComEC
MSHRVGETAIVSALPKATSDLGAAETSKCSRCHVISLPERLRLGFVARPLAWAAGAAVLGVLGGDHNPGLCIALSLTLVGAAAVVARRARGTWRAPFVYLGGLALFAALMAAWTSVVTQPGPRDVARLIGRRAGVIGTVASEPQVSAGGGVRFLLQCEAAEMEGGRVAVAGLLHVSALEPVRLGDRIQVFGLLAAPRPATNPGGFSEAAWLRRRGAFAVLHARPQAIVHPTATGGPRPSLIAAWRLRCARWRRGVTEANRRALRGRADLVNSLVFGALDVGDPAEWRETERAYRLAGLVHLLVVSGTQVMLLLVPLLALLRAASGSRITTWGVFLLLLLVAATYVEMAGAGASVVRAAVMAMLIAGAWPLRREPDVENTLGFALLLFLIFWPPALDDIGLQLSLAAVWGLARLTEPLRRLLHRALPGSLAAEHYPLFARGRNGVLTAAAASLAATLATAPLLAHHFGEFTPAALLSNLIAVPVAALLLYCGWCASLLNVRVPALAAPVNAVTASLADGLNAVSHTFAGLVGGHLGVFPPGWLAVGLCFAGLALAAVWGHATPRRPSAGNRRVALALVMAVVPLALSMVWPAWPPRGVEVTFIDVGQGDAALVRLPEGAVILIDGGGSPSGTFDVGERVMLPFLRYRRIPRIDLLILTHPHDDHLAGLLAVAEQYPIRAVLDSAQPFDTPNYRRFLRAVQRRHLRYLRARRGMELRWPSTRVEILHPVDPLLRATHSDPNNNSIVCRLTYGHTRFLFAGDAEAEAEHVLRASGQDLHAEVLKVGHHGSPFSTDAAWLHAVHPSLAVISCGRDNIFGHPAKATLARLQAAGVRMWRTDEDGAVTVRSDGERVWGESVLAKERYPAIGRG